MSPTLNYLPEGKKLFEIEGKNILRLSACFSFFMDLANSYLNVWYFIGLQFMSYFVFVNRLHVKLSSVRPLVWNRSM